MKKFTAVTAIISLLFSITAISHHYVLVPEKFIYQPGDTMNLHLMVGEVFNYEFERELHTKSFANDDGLFKTGSKNSG